MADAVRIAILGEFDATSPTLPSVDTSLQHAADKLKFCLESQWVATPSLVESNPTKLESFDGIWAAPGSPYKSLEGMLKGIEFARRRDWPFLATCGGFQYTLIECARNVLGIADADSAENNSGSKNIVIHPVACAVPGRSQDAPRLSGAIPEIRLRPGSYLHSFYGQDTITEEFFCNFEVNPEYAWTAMEAGFPVVARGPQGEILAIESPTHRFFVATLFQPQLSSRPNQPHPLVMAFVQAAADWGKKKLDDNVLE